jgi:CheY-like chemotaxis protein/nitrogen-specific signal transduction histidine kinase
MWMVMNIGHHIVLYVIKGDSERLSLAQKRANRMKDDFLSCISHELRTPLNTILGSVDLIKCDDNPENAECIKIIQESAILMLGLVNDILDMAKLAEGKLYTVSENMVPRKIIDKMYRHAMVLSGPNVVIHKEIDCDVPVTIVGDYDRTYQVISNLVSNAIKFTERGTITIGMKLSEDRAKVIWEVKDTGIGIPTNKHSSIFKRFEQEDMTITRKYGGTGLGLSLSRDLVHLMGGNIGVSSMKGVGSTFWFTIPLSIPDSNVEDDSLSTGNVDDLYERSITIRNMLDMQVAIIESTRTRRTASQPIAESAETDTGDSSSTCESPTPNIMSDSTTRVDKVLPISMIVQIHKSDSPKENLRVLVVEDNRVNIKVVVMLLKRLGVECDVSENGQEAVNRFKTPEDLKKYGVVLMDCHMPILDGYEATKKIREREKELLMKERLVICGLTADVTSTNKYLCILAGMDYHKVKPLRLETLSKFLTEIGVISPKPKMERSYSLPLVKTDKLKFAASRTRSEPTPRYVDE